MDKSRSVFSKKAKKFVNLNKEWFAIDVNKFQERKAFWAKQKLFDTSCKMQLKEYQGIYEGKEKKHLPDIQKVMQRAKDFGVKKFLLTPGNLAQVKEPLEFCAKQPGAYTTLGLSPGRTMEIYFDAQKPEPNFTKQRIADKKIIKMFRTAQESTPGNADEKAAM